MIQNKDLFGNPVIEDVILRDKYIEPPFSVLDTKTGNWQGRKNAWIAKGIKSEVGRDAKAIHGHEWLSDKNIDNVNDGGGVSIFDPVLCEIAYSWFCPTDGKILDPFAGGSVRGIVANQLGYKYTGIDLRPEQAESNRDQAINILPVDNQPQYYCGDSDEILSRETLQQYDMVFSCPPYLDLEKYSDDPNDLSNMSHDKFMVKYESIIKKSIQQLKGNRFAAWVVGDVRNKKGFFHGLIDKTKQYFIDNGANLYNDVIILNSIGSARIRARGQFDGNRKVVTVHQRMLIFFKGNPNEIKNLKFNI